MPKVTLTIEAKELIIVTEDHGGYKAGHCFACKASGWISGFGYPARAKKVPGNHLKHRVSCPMNGLLNDGGSFINNS